MSGVRLPRLLNSSMAEAQRIHPVDGSLALNIVPLSTASLQVLTKDTVPTGSWIEMFSPSGSAGIYRVSSVSNGYGSEISTLELEHGIAEVGNYVVAAEISEEMPLKSAISTLWGHYKGTRWKLGTNTFTDNVLVDVMYDNLLQAMLDVMEQTSGYMLDFDFSKSPWVINIVRKDTSVSAEGRLSRNVEEASITYDLTDLCTRAYVDYDSDDSSGGTLSVDADTISQFGLIEKHITGSGYTASQAQTAASEYLQKHKKPQASVTITGRDLASITGESLDKLAVGKLYRLAIPKYNTFVEETITELNWPNLYTDPTSVEVTLGQEEDKVISHLKETTTTVTKSGKGTIKKQGRYWTKFERTDHYIDQVAAYTDENGNILKQAGMYIDANGVLQYAQDNEKQIGSQFKVAADRITAEVTQRENGERALYSSIEQTASQIRTEVVNVKEGLESSITQTASQIRAEVKSTKEGLESSISQTATQIRAEVKSTKEGLESSISQTATQIRAEVKSTKEGLESSISQTATQIRAEVKSTKEGLESSISQTATQIRAEVKSTKEGLESSISQTATQIRAEVKSTKEGLESSISQTATQILSEVSDTASGLQSYIDQQRDRISLVVEGTGSNAKIRPAQIVASINNATKESSVLISADRVRLSGNTTVDDSMTIENGALLVKKAAVFGTTSGRQVSINNGSVNAQTLQVNSDGKLVIVGSATGEHYDITSTVIQGMIKSASVNGNVLTLTPFYGSDITFSKATSLSGAWSGGKYTVTASPQGNTISTSPVLTLDGNGSSNFSVKLQHPTGASQLADTGLSKYIYLALSGSGAAAAVKAGENSDGSSSVGSLAVGSLYTDGRNSVTINKGNWSGGQIQFTKSAGTASTKGVQVGLSGGWGTDGDANHYVCTIMDSYDNPQGVATGAAITIDATARYNAGWTDAYGKVYVPDTKNISDGYITVYTPPSTVGGSAKSTKFDLVVGNTYGYIYNGSTIVARVTHNKYAEGQANATVNNWARDNFEQDTTARSSKTLAIPVHVDVGGVTRDHTFYTGEMTIERYASTSYVNVKIGSTIIARLFADGFDD